ncbi:MAG: glutathione S-transferase family protein [Gammaproteobacteria bacterium]
MDNLILYDTALSLNCYKVRLLLSFLGLGYCRVPVDLLQGEHRTAEFLALNPFGEVPVLLAGTQALRDSQSILVWLARKTGATAWMPDEADEEAEVNAWLAAAGYELRLGPYDARLAKIYPVLCVNESKAMERAAAALALYEARLAGREWVALDRPTVADVAAFPAIAQSGDGDVKLEAFPAVRAWMDRFRALPGFKSLLD